MIPQFSQLFIYTPDKSNSVCKIFISTPPLDRERNLGRLFGIIEIEATDRALWETANSLAQELERNYYGEDNLQITVGRPNREISVEETFEKAIRNFNDRLIELIKGGKLASLIDKINIIIGVLKDEELLFAAVGNTGAFLIHQLKSQEYRIIDILDNTGGKENKINPFKVLANIVTGRVEKNNSLLFCTNSLLDYLSLDKIRQTLTTREPAQATRYLKDLLLEASINTTFASIVVKLVATEQEETEEQHEVVEIKLPQRSLDHLIITEKTTEEYLSPPLQFNLKKYSRLAVSQTQKIAQSLLMATQTYWQKQKAAKEKKQRIITANKTEMMARPPQPLAQPLPLADNHPTKPVATSEVKPIKNRPLITRPKMPSRFWPIAKKTLSQSYSIIYLIIKKVWLAIRWLYLVVSNKNKNRREMLQNIYSSTVDFFAGYLKRFQALPKQSRILLIVSLILFVLFTQSLIQLTKDRLAKAEAKTIEQTLSQIEQKNNEIEGALIYNDETRAGQLLAEAQSLFNQIKVKNQKNQAAVDAVKQKLDLINQKLQHLIVLDQPTALANFNTLADNQTFDATTLEINDGQLYSINKTANAFYSISRDNGQINDLKITANNPQIKDSFIIKNSIYYYHGGNGLVRLDLTKNKISEVTVDLTDLTGQIKSLSSYNGRLYLLASNQIYRFNGVLDNFAGRTNWLKNGDATDGISLTVDGDAYLLTKNGEIKKYTNGRSQDFSNPNLEPKIGDAAKIWTDAVAKNLYILDPQNKRLITINKTQGKIVAQYASANFTNLKNFTVAEKDKKAYLLNDNSIYQIDLVK